MNDVSEKPIFIFASSQRCGSTLLQRLLNSYPNVLIWGEQGGYLNTFLQGYDALRNWESLFSKHRETFLCAGYDNFVACMVPDSNELSNIAASHIQALFGLSANKYGKSIWGFKEARCDIRVALFLQECFPQARFIHLTRNIVDCFISLKKWEISPAENPEVSWNRALTEKAIEDWQRINASFLNSANVLSKILSIRYEDMINDPNGFIIKLAQFLEMEAEKFDLHVFSKKLYEEHVTGVLDLRPKIFSSDLNSEERSLLLRTNVLEIASSYGYTINL